MSRPAGSQQTHYGVLGLSRSCTQEEIKQAYRKIALKHHPDRGKSGNVELFKRAVEAYETLGDATKRRSYDISIAPQPKVSFGTPSMYNSGAFSDLFDFTFQEVYTGMPKRRPASTSSRFFSDFNFFNFGDPFEFKMPWSRRAASSTFRSSNGSARRTPSEPKPWKTGPSRHFAESSNVNASVHESYDRATRIPTADSDSPEPQSPTPESSPEIPRKRKTDPGPSVDPSIIDLTHESGDEAEPEVVHESPKRQRSSTDTDSLPRSKRAKFDLHNMGSVPPFSQTNGNFTMGDMATSMPNVSPRARQYNASKRESRRASKRPRTSSSQNVPMFSGVPTLDQALDHAEKVRDFLFQNLDYSETLFTNVGSSAQKLKSQTGELVMNPKKVQDLIDGTRADIQCMREWIEKMETQQKVLENWKPTLDRIT